MDLANARYALKKCLFSFVRCKSVSIVRFLPVPMNPATMEATSMKDSPKIYARINITTMGWLLWLHFAFRVYALLYVLILCSCILIFFIIINKRDSLSASRRIEYIVFRQREPGNLVLRHSVPIRILLLNPFVKRNSMSCFASLLERRHKIVKYLFSSSKNWTQDLSHDCALAPRQWQHY